MPNKLFILSKIKSNIFLFATFFFGILTQTLTMIKSGLVYDFGMGFWGPNAHDGLWHIALINQISKGSLKFPTFAEDVIVNYHIGFDVFAAIIHKITSLPIIFVYFQLLPVVFSLSYGLLIYVTSSLIFRSKRAAAFSVFLAYFGGSFGWLVNLLRRQSIGGESMFWSMQSISFLINPPFIFSVILLLSGLVFFFKYLETKTWKNLLVSGMLFGVLIQVKVYAGVIALLALFLSSATEFFLRFNREKKLIIPKTFFLFICSLAVAVLVFFPLNRGSQSILVFKPWWFIETMFAFNDRLGILRMELIRESAILTPNYLKYFFWLFSGLIIFLVGNLGTRVMGFLSLKEFTQKNIYPPLKLFILYSLFISFLLPMFLIQKGTNWNTIQFFYYFLVIMSLLGGEAMDRLTKNRKWWANLIIFIFVILTLPTTLSSLRNYLPLRPPAKISKLELEGLKFLAKQPQGTVLTFPYNPKSKENFVEPRPVWAYVSTAYVSALTGKISFLEDEMNLDITNRHYQQRLKDETKLFDTNNKPWARDFLVSNKIRYIYLVDEQSMRFNEAELDAKRIYENPQVRIFRVSW